MKYLLLVPLLFTFCTTCWAENKPKNSYLTDMAKDAPRADEYGIALSYIKDFLVRLQTHHEQLAQGKVSEFPMNNLPRDFYKLYASSYLACSLTNGICKEFLDTILEVDLINSKISGKVSCINTLKSWKAWLDNDMEKRHNFQTKITHVNLVSAFNRDERPKYHRCSKTIANLIADSSVTPSEFFKQRYSGELAADNFIQKTIDFYKLVDEKKIDIYETVGFE